MKKHLWKFTLRFQPRGIYGSLGCSQELPGHVTTRKHSVIEATQKAVRFAKKNQRAYRGGTVVAVRYVGLVDA